METKSKDAHNRVRIRVTGPYEETLKLFRTFDYTVWIHEHKLFMEQELSVKPVYWYSQFLDRIKYHGLTASFPEFRGTVGALTRQIFQNERVYEWLSENRAVDLQQIIHKLISIQIETRYLWPYQSTILCIEDMLGLLDVYYRNLHKDTFANYYHNFRYRVYLTHILQEPEYICFPTICVLGTQHFIKLRCVPVLLLGVAYRPLLADQYVNTPLDFWAHDIQHARRQIQETEKYYDTVVKHQKYYTNRSPFDLVSKIDFYIEMENFTRHLFILLGDEMVDLQVHNLIKMIIFEVVHEKAWPVTRYSLLRNIQLGYDTFPIENLIISSSGISTEDHIFDDPTTLSNMRGKLRNGFYDPVNSPITAIVSPKYRTSRQIVNAVEVLFDYLKFTKGRYPKEVLLALVKDPLNTNEFKDYGTEIDIPDDPEGPVGYPEGFIHTILPII